MGSKRGFGGKFSGFEWFRTLFSRFSKHVLLRNEVRNDVSEVGNEVSEVGNEVSEVGNEVSGSKSGFGVENRVSGSKTGFRGRKPRKNRKNVKTWG